MKAYIFQTDMVILTGLRLHPGATRANLHLILLTYKYWLCKSIPIQMLFSYKYLWKFVVIELVFIGEDSLASSPCNHYAAPNIGNSYQLAHTIQITVGDN